MKRLWWIAAGCLLVAGCSGTDSDQPSAAAPEVQEAEAPEETVFDPLVGTMDRAENVDAVSADRMDELNKQLAESE